MTEAQKTLCAIALFANGYSRPQVARALSESEGRVQELVEAGANAQARGGMGYMKSSTWAKKDPDITYETWAGGGDPAVPRGE